MPFRTLFDIPFGIPNVYLLAPEKPLTASPPSVSDRWFPRREGRWKSHTLLVFPASPWGDGGERKKKAVYHSIFP